MAKVAAVLVAMVLVVVAATSAGRVSAVKCDPDELTVCKAPVIGAAPPSPTCCSNLRAQQDCFCKYAHDPAYRKYVMSPGAPHTLIFCGIPIPKC